MLNALLDWTILTYVLLISSFAFLFWAVYMAHRRIDFTLKKHIDVLYRLIEDSQDYTENVKKEIYEQVKDSRKWIFKNRDSVFSIKETLVNAQGQQLKTFGEISLLRAEMLKNRDKIRENYISTLKGRSCSEAKIELKFPTKDSGIKQLNSNQTFVGNKKNLSQDGAWIGQNILKIVRFENEVFTYAIANDGKEKKAFLYSKPDDHAWKAGISFELTRPPNIFADSKGHIHLVGHKLFDQKVSGTGQLFHIKFHKRKSITGGHDFEFITPDSREKISFSTKSSYYCGAAIDERDFIYVAYNNSFNFKPPHSLGLRICKPESRSWTFHTVQDNLKSRLAYPFVKTSAEELHIVAVENDYSEKLEHTGYPFLYGMVKHFVLDKNTLQLKSESVIIDFHESMSKHEISDLNLRVTDVLMDVNSNLHVMIRYKTKNDLTRMFHFRKKHEEENWNLIHTSEAEFSWAKFWENTSGQLHIIGSSWVEDILLMNEGFTEPIAISKLDGPCKIDPVPFVAPKSAKSLPGVLDVVLFNGYDELPGVAIQTQIE